MKIGEIISNTQNEQILIVNIDKNEFFRGIPLSSASDKSKWIVELKDTDVDSTNIPMRFIDVSKSICFGVNQIDKSIATVSQTAMDTILRLLVKHSAKMFYKYSEENKSTRSYTPPSGKILDENELFNMIEASLDMWLTTGRFNTQFERKLAKFLGVNYTLTVNSGSSANLLAISALTSHKLGDRAIRPNDEVITIASGFPTTVSPIVQNSLIPVFVDATIGTYNIDVNKIEEAISDKTKAIFLAHTLGNPYDLDAIMKIAEKYKLWVIEDNCDSLGSEYNGKLTGSYGHISTMSFYPAHHITMGEGGAVATNDNQLYKILMSYRDWGRDCWCPPGRDNTCKQRFNQQFGNLPFGYDHKYTYSHFGYNFKITDWQASIALSQLDKVNTFIEKRRDNFDALHNGLKKLDDFLILPKATAKSKPSWFGFLITVKENDNFNKLDLVKYLEENGVGTRQLFAGNMLRQPCFIDSHIPLRIANSDLLWSDKLTENEYKLLPNTDIIMNSTFWIGLWPGLDSENIKEIINIFEKFIKINVSLKE